MGNVNDGGRVLTRGCGHLRRPYPGLSLLAPLPGLFGTSGAGLRVLGLRFASLARNGAVWHLRRHATLFRKSVEGFVEDVFVFELYFEFFEYRLIFVDETCVYVMFRLASDIALDCLDLRF